MAKTKHYQHFCPVARSLEVIGERWSLLIVRDLLGGEKRFTDLMRGLSNITPKWLTMRLRELEDAGIVERVHEPGKREVWYRLSPTGRELGGVIGELNAWGLRHAMRPPQEDEVVGEGRFGRSLLEAKPIGKSRTETSRSRTNAWIFSRPSFTPRKRRMQRSRSSMWAVVRALAARFLPQFCKACATLT